MRTLLIFTSLAEAAFGLALSAAPQFIGKLLIGREVDSPASTVARVFGLLLVVLGVICWPRGDLRRGSRWMLIYSILANLLLVALGLNGMAGVLLWPAAVVHAAITVLLLWSRRSSSAAGTEQS